MVGGTVYRLNFCQPTRSPRRRGQAHGGRDCETKCLGGLALPLAGRSSYRPIAQSARRTGTRARAERGQSSPYPASGSALRDRVRRAHIEDCSAVRGRTASAPDPLAHGSGPYRSDGKLSLNWLCFYTARRPVRKHRLENPSELDVRSRYGQIAGHVFWFSHERDELARITNVG